MDLKHTTKAELWRSYQKLEADSAARINELSAALDKAAKEKDGLTEELRLMDAARKETLRDLKDMREDMATLNNLLGEKERRSDEDLAKIRVLMQERDRARTLAESYKRGLDWCIEHPWKNLGKCWKGDRRY